MLKTPTYEQFTTVIETLNKVLPMAERDDQLDMTEGLLRGTVLSFEGWYYRAKKGDLQKHRYNFIDGARLVAVDLGFKDFVELEDWADNSPELWLNYNGGNIFSDAIAFASKSRPKGAKNLKDIRDHFIDVRDGIYVK
jgi:hypothetical protein